MTISNDSIKFQMLRSRNATKGFERSENKHFGIYSARTKKIIIIASKETSDYERYIAMTFTNIKNNHSIELAGNGVRNATATINELIELSTKDTTQLFGNVFYHADQIKEFEKLKDPKKMDLSDFKIFLRKLIETKNRNRFRKRVIANTFQDQILNSSLIELGYNPLFRNDLLNILLEKYLSDQEVAKIYHTEY